jgi:hypothetical protein
LRRGAGPSLPPLPLIVDYIDSHKHEFGVEPICAVLTHAGVKIAPSTYYVARSRPPSARAVRDAVITEKIKEVHETNYGVYGVRKIYAELTRQGGLTGRSVAQRRPGPVMPDERCGTSVPANADTPLRVTPNGDSEAWPGQRGDSACRPADLRSPKDRKLHWRGCRSWLSSFDA